MRELLLLTYKLKAQLPMDEMFILTSQMKRAALSVLSNFVEGYLKKSKKEKIHFMDIANTSLLELEAQSEACLILGYWSEENYREFDKQRSEVGYFLYRYKTKIDA